MILLQYMYIYKYIYIYIYKTAIPNLIMFMLNRKKPTRTRDS